MALPSSGALSLNQVNVELKKTATAAISMNDAAVRALAKVASGAISMSNLHGKSSEVVYINSTTITQANIHTLMGSPTVANIFIFENTGTISAASAGGWALQTGTFPAGSTLTIINKGAIRGGGGNGSSNGGVNGGAGGTALILNFPASINNTGGTIWGGGGGGGGLEVYGQIAGGGGGAGIPAGNGAAGTYPGSNGTAVAGGAGGGAGGNGGAPGASGSGYNATGVFGPNGGRGGYSVQRNGNAVTWIAVGDRKGSEV